MKVTAESLHSFTPTDDALVLASVDTPAEVKMLDDWLAEQRKAHPDARIEVLQLPSENEPPPAVLARLVELLEVDEGRSVVPVRVFWIPGGLPTRSKVVALLSGRDTYRPPKLLQRNILRKDASRARVVAGEPATVAELRKNWTDTTVAENPRDFARFVMRRAELAIDRVELRLLGPEYKSPRLDQAGVVGVGSFSSRAREDPRRHR